MMKVNDAMKITACLIGGLFILNGHAYAEPASKMESQATWLYAVKKNESFERIYQKYLNKHANILALSKLNQHKLTKKLQPGQVMQIPVEMLKKIATPAQVTVAYGDVIATTAAGQQRKINQGDQMQQGETVQTGKNSLAKLLFADGSVVNVQPNSSLGIQSSFKYVGKETFVANLKLGQGRTEISANPNHTVGNAMQIETPSAIAAVRGTQFRVVADGNLALQETLEGQVAFSATGQEVLLAKGYGSLAEKNKAPLPPIALPSAPVLDALPTLVESKLAEFNLASQQDAGVWVGQLALDEAFTKVVSEQVTQTAKLAFADLVDGQYYLKVRAQDAHGLQGADAVHVFNVKVKAPELELIEPLDGATIPLAPTEFRWSSAIEAGSYLVQIARDAKFEKMITFERKTNSNQLSVNQTFGAGEYYWRVAILVDGKPQKFSTARKFVR